MSEGVNRTTGKPPGATLAADAETSAEPTGSAPTGGNAPGSPPVRNLPSGIRHHLSALGPRPSPLLRPVTVRFEQAVYGSFAFRDGGYSMLEQSPGCRPEWLADFRAACQRFGERPA